MSGTLPEYDKIVRWTINDVGQWLVANSFNDFCKSFREHGIDGSKFVTLEQINLNQMRTPMNKRNKLLQIIKSIKKPEVDTRTRVSEIVNERRQPPSLPRKDYSQPPQTDNGWDGDGSASGSDDDYEWNENEFDDDEFDEDQGDDYVNVVGWYQNQTECDNETVTGYCSLHEPQDSGYDRGGTRGYHDNNADDGDDQDDYENLEEALPARPLHTRHEHGGTIVDKLKDALNKRENTIQRNQAPPSHDSDDEGSSSDYEDPVDASVPPPLQSRTRPDKGSSQTPHIPSRPGRAQQPPPPRKTKAEVELPEYEESVQNDEPEQVYDEPDKPSLPSRNKQLGNRPPIPVPGRQDKAPSIPSGKHKGSRAPPPVPEPEETYEVPDELAPAPPQPVEDQELYEDPDNEPAPPPPPSRGKQKVPHLKPQILVALPGMMDRLPPRPAASKPSEPDSSKPVLPPPRNQRGKHPKASLPPEPAGYMAMSAAPPVETEDEYLDPDELNNDKPGPKVSAPPPTSTHQHPAPVRGRIRRMEDMTEEEKQQFKLPPFPSATSPKKKTTPTRDLPPPPVQAHRPLPPKPEPEPAPQPVDDINDSPDEGDFKDNLENFDWYKGEMTREEGDRKLKKNRTDGMYLIRKSKGGGRRPYTLMIFNNNSVFNLPIRLRDDEQFAMGNEKKNEQTFETLADMVEFFTKRTIILAGGSQTRLKYPMPN